MDSQANVMETFILGLHLWDHQDSRTATTRELESIY